MGPEGKRYGVERVVVYDALTYAGNIANLEGLTDPAKPESEQQLRFVRGDIRDAERIDATLAEEKLDTIVNFAAESHVDRSILDPLAFVRTNIEGTQVLLNAMAKAGISRYLQISTDEVYGSLGPEGRFTEQTPICPSSTYSASKAAADLLVLAAFTTHGLPVLITRCSNNYGPYQFPEKLIPLFITNAMADQPLPLYGDGKNIRSWLHVDDHSRAIMLVLQGGKPGEVYNVGGAPESEKENLQVTEAILDAVGKPRTLVRRVTDRKGHDRRYAVDYSKIERELGWKPQIGFTEGLRSTVQWYRDNQQWWTAVKTGEYQKFYDRYYRDRLV